VVEFLSQNDRSKSRKSAINVKATASASGGAVDDLENIPVEDKAESKNAAREQEAEAREPSPTVDAPPSTPEQDPEPEKGKDPGPRSGDRTADQDQSAPESEKENLPRRPRRRRRPRSGGNKNSGEQSAPPGPEAPAASIEPWDPAAFAVEPVEGKTRFQDLDVPSEILHAIADLGFSFCTPIQKEILPHTLKGQDASGRAQTGTGKTAAFLITIFAHMLRNPPEANRRNGTPRALVIAPTRELALQIEKDALDLGKYCGLTTLAVFGGMDYGKQQSFLKENVIDLVIATPGRLLDYRRRQDIHFNRIETLVIDEADRMLDMGFIPDVRQIVHATPPKSKRQTMFFSATLTKEVMRLAGQWTRDPVSVEIEPDQVAVDSVDQKVFIVTTREKFPLLLNIVLKDDAERVMIFANRRDQTRRLYELLQRYDVSCALLSGDVPQTKRVKTLENFRSGQVRVLVATDVAGRGIHVDAVSHVINFTLPHDAEDYVHRIGRTGRAGATGTSISFACEEDAFYIPKIEEYIGNELVCTHPEPEMLKVPPPFHPPMKSEAREGSASRPPRRGGGGGRGGGGSRGGGRSGGR